MAAASVAWGADFSTAPEALVAGAALGAADVASGSAGEVAGLFWPGAVTVDAAFGLVDVDASTLEAVAVLLDAAETTRSASTGEGADVGWEDAAAAIVDLFAELSALACAGVAFTLRAFFALA